jgi:hypothetical protein
MILLASKRNFILGESIVNAKIRQDASPATHGHWVALDPLQWRRKPIAQRYQRMGIKGK